MRNRRPSRPTRPWRGAFILALLLCGAGEPMARDAGAGTTKPLVSSAPPVEIARASFDTTSGWGDCGLAEDGPLRFEPTTEPGEVHEGKGAVRLVFDVDAGPLGMKYYRLPGVAGSDGYAFWLRGDGSGASLQVRLSQGDWSAWDSPFIPIDFRAWRRIVILRSECVFRNFGGRGPNWDDIRIFAVRLSGRSCRCVIDDLRFYKGAAALKQRAIPAGRPLTLRIDLAKELPPVPDTLKGVDFALVNWGAGMKDLNFGQATERLFRRSGARVVRFWPFCPALGVSLGPGRYDWSRFDGQMKKIYDAGAEVIMTCCFTPRWLSVDGTKEGMPRDWDAYERLIGDTVRHCRRMGWRVRYWEVWNEPDLETSEQRFLNGGIGDLCEIYGHFARAVRRADRDALVGGGGFARANMAWMRSLVQYAHDHDLPLDFLSWHGYELTPDGIASSIDSARKLLASFPRFKNTLLVIDEWQAYGGPQNSFDTEYAAAYQAATLHRMLERGLHMSVFFAFKEMNWRSPEREFCGSWGMITARDTPKPSYHSFRIFAELRGDRVSVFGGDGEVGAIAARRGDGLDVMVYRFQPLAGAPERCLRLELLGWKAGKFRLTMELVDSSHSNPLFDRRARHLERVGTWTSLDPGRLATLQFWLEPLSVARFRVEPEAEPRRGLQP